MNQQSASTKQLVDEFKRRVSQAAPQPDDPLSALCTRNLRDLKPFGGELLDTLEAAHEAFAQNPSEPALAQSLEAALVAVYRFGLAWETSLIRERAIELLQVCEDSCQAVGKEGLLRVARLALYQLSLKLDADQVAEIALVTPKATTESQAIEYHRQLDLALPRHILVESDHVLDIAEDAAGSIMMGRVFSHVLKNQLSGSINDSLLPFSELHHLTQSLVNSFVLLIPALRRNLGELNFTIDIPAGDMVDTLAWVAKAAFFERARKSTQSQQGKEGDGKTNPEQLALYAIKDLAWVGLAVLLDPKCSWADELSYERKDLIEYARGVLRDDQELNRAYSNRVGLTFFLSTADASPLAKHDWQSCLSKLVLTMRNLAPSSKVMPTPGDCLAAAMAWWLRTPHEDALWAMTPPASPAILKQAFWGRVTHPMVQSYLYRALEEQQ
jgi:hypothetical protein